MAAVALSNVGIAARSSCQLRASFLDDWETEARRIARTLRY